MRRNPGLMREPAHGFTLLELAVVMGVIAILTLMALPSYLDRIVRKQIEAAMPLADVAKRPVAAAWALTQTLPADNTEAGLPSADRIVGNYVSAVQVVAGAVHMTFGNSAHGALKGKVLTLRPAIVEDAPVVPPAWVCGNAAVPAKMTAKGENRTTVPNLYLPLECAGRKQ
jgi:type IV pilus assembly protein PilA